MLIDWFTVGAQVVNFLILAWLLKHPSGIIPIVGSCNPANIRDAVRADTLALSREDWYRLLVAARGEGLP